MQIIKSSTVTWVDIISPSQRDVHRLMHDFNIHPLAATQLKDPTIHPIVEHYGAYLYVVLHFPMYNETRGRTESVEIDFVITPTTLLTVRYIEIIPLDAILKRCSFVQKKNTSYCLDKGPFFLFYYLVKELFKYSGNEIDRIHTEVESAEDAIFDGREKEMVGRLSLLRRDIINFMSALKPQRLVLEALLARDLFVDEFTRPYMQDLLHEYDKTLNLISTEREMTDTLYATNESLLNARTSEVMKTLTIMAFVTFPLMLFSSLFGMNTERTPIIGHPADFWIIVGIMALVTVGFFLFFKERKWL